MTEMCQNIWNSLCKVHKLWIPPGIVLCNFTPCSIKDSQNTETPFSVSTYITNHSPEHIQKAKFLNMKKVCCLLWEVFEGNKCAERGTGENIRLWKFHQVACRVRGWTGERVQGYKSLCHPTLVPSDHCALLPLCNHPCALMPLFPPTLVPFFLSPPRLASFCPCALPPLYFPCALLPLHPHTLLSMWTHTLVPFCSCTLASLYPCTIAPFHPCSISTLYPCTLPHLLALCCLTLLALCAPNLSPTYSPALSPEVTLLN